MFETVAGIDALVVPYKGSPAVLTALRAGEIDVAFEIAGAHGAAGAGGRGEGAGGQLRPAQPGAADVPTAVQAGLAGYNVASWNALAAPAAPPPEVLAVLGKAVGARPWPRPGVREKLGKLGMRVQGSSPAEAAGAAGQRDPALGRCDPRRQDRARVARAGPSWGCPSAGRPLPDNPSSTPTGTPTVQTVTRRSRARFLQPPPALLAAGAAQAQAWPSKPIRAIVPLPPAAPPTRSAAPSPRRCRPTLGQPIVIDNKPGANGMLGADIVAKAPADGYTILVGTNSTNAALKYLMKKLPYDQDTASRRWASWARCR